VRGSVPNRGNSALPEWCRRGFVGELFANWKEREGAQGRGVEKEERGGVERCNRDDRRKLTHMSGEIRGRERDGHLGP